NGNPRFRAGGAQFSLRKTTHSFGINNLRKPLHQQPLALRLNFPSNVRAMFVAVATRPAPSAAGRIPTGEPTIPFRFSNRDSAIRKSSKSSGISIIKISNRDYIAVFQLAFYRLATLFALVLAVSAAPLFAQGVRVEGSVHDSSGASIPNAQIEL